MTKGIRKSKWGAICWMYPESRHEVSVTWGARDRYRTPPWIMPLELPLAPKARSFRSKKYDAGTAKRQVASDAASVDAAADDRDVELVHRQLTLGDLHLRRRRAKTELGSVPASTALAKTGHVRRGSRRKSQSRT